MDAVALAGKELPEARAARGEAPMERVSARAALKADEPRQRLHLPKSPAKPDRQTRTTHRAAAADVGGAGAEAAVADRPEPQAL